MNDLEDRLRSTLDEVAGAVPVSPYARADLARRLTRRSRRPVLMAAAAAVVVAAVVISVALTQDGDPVDQTPWRAATAPPPDIVWPRTTSKLPNGDLAGPVELGQFSDGEVTYVVMLSVIAMNDGEHWSLTPYGPPGHEWPVGSSEIVPTWPSGSPGVLVKTYPVLAMGTVDSGPLPHLKVFVTSPAVTTLEVSRADGHPVTVRQVARTPGATFYLADFAGPTEGFGYTAKDAAGNVVESAIS